MFEYGGYAGKILRVNLTKTSIKIEPLTEQLAKAYIGGRGLGAQMLYEEVKPRVHPLGPENKLFFASGPLEGTISPMASKFVIVTKSPLTKIYLYTVASGFFGPEIKSSGFDTVVIEGRAEEPLYLWVNEGNAELRDASHLWGMTTSDVQEAIKKETGEGKARVACIGPAGENLVRYACVISDRRAAGRGGAGAVMGSKKLKAIAVRGTKEAEIYDADGLKKAVETAYRRLREDTHISQTLPKYGTPFSLTLMNEYGMLPTKNYQEGVFDGAEELSAEILRERFLAKERYVSCSRCPSCCARISEVREGLYRGSFTEGPEYETIWALGPMCGNANLASIIAMDNLCDELGIDTMSLGNTIGFAMECYEKGLLSKEETDGLELKVGNYEAMVTLVRQVAQAAGFGRLLAEGVRELSRRIGKGSEQFAMHVKGLEMGGYDPRGAKGLAIIYATGNRGGCHHASGYIITREVSSGTVDRFAIEGKGKLVEEFRNLRVAYDSAILCTHAVSALGMEIPAALLSAATGLSIDSKVLSTIADRINNVERAFNIREGVTRLDDNLPERILREPLLRGPSAGQVVKLAPLLDDYYAVCGWDKTGIPKPERLKELDLVDVSEDLEIYRKKGK